MKTLATAIKHLRKVYEEYLRVFGADHKTVQALKIVLEVLKSEYPHL